MELIIYKVTLGKDIVVDKTQHFRPILKVIFKLSPSTKPPPKVIGYTHLQQPSVTKDGITTFN